LEPAANTAAAQNRKASEKISTEILLAVSNITFLLVALIHYTT
jgi:hypothetical protein